MDKASVVVKGAVELGQKLEKLKKTEAAACLRKGCRAGTKIVTAAAKSKTPVDTSELKKNMKTRAMKRKKDRIGYNTISTTKGGYKLYYGHMVNNGFTTRNGRFIEGQKFMNKAADEAGPRALETAIDITKAEIERKMKL